MSEAITKALQDVPVVSDEQIRKTVEAVQDPDTVPAFHNGYYTLTPGELRRVILALRPAVEPMTDEQRRFDAGCVVLQYLKDTGRHTAQPTTC